MVDGTETNGILIPIIIPSSLRANSLSMPNFDNKIGIKMEQTKKFLSTFANIKEINIWCSISEDPEGGIYWVSIRSKRTKISDVARKYQGGGHDLASGCKLNSINELELLINDLDNLLK